MDWVDIAAVVYAVLTGAVVAFQLALAAGVPWGAYAMGGAYPGTYPAPMRVAAVIQAGVLGFLGLLVMARAGLLAVELPQWLIWVVVAIAAVGFVLNSITRSAGERRIWAPVTAVMLVSSVIVAIAS